MTDPVTAERVAALKATLRDIEPVSVHEASGDQLRWWSWSDDAIEIIDALIGLIDEFVDPNPCRYDHHDFCQEHNLDPRPCPHERARAILP